MVEKIFNDIFSISRSLQKKRTISFLGPHGSYSHQAAMAVFSQDANLVPKDDIASVMQEVITGRADLAIVPVENSTEGMINQTLDLLVISNLHVIQEIMLPIRNCLLGKTSLEKIEKVFEDLSNLAAANQLRIHQIRTNQTPSSPAAEQQHPGIEEQGFLLELEGEFQGVQAFLETLEKQPRILRLDEIRLLRDSKKSEDSTVQANFRLRFFSRKGTKAS